MGIGARAPMPSRQRFALSETLDAGKKGSPDRESRQGSSWRSETVYIDQ
jgi:hypothetical protein